MAEVKPQYVEIELKTGGTLKFPNAYCVSWNWDRFFIVDMIDGSRHGFAVGEVETWSSTPMPAAAKEETV